MQSTFQLQFFFYLTEILNLQGFHEDLKQFTKSVLSSMIHFNGYILNFSELVLVNIAAFFTTIFKSPHITIYIFCKELPRFDGGFIN